MKKCSAFCQIIAHHKKDKRKIVDLDKSGLAPYPCALKGQRCLDVHDWGRKGADECHRDSSWFTVGLFTRPQHRDFQGLGDPRSHPQTSPRAVCGGGVRNHTTLPKGKDMEKALEKDGHTLLYLPPYSPDLNPMEHKWAQAKAIRRRQQTSIEKLFLSWDLLSVDTELAVFHHHQQIFLAIFNRMFPKNLLI